MCGKNTATESSLTLTLTTHFTTLSLCTIPTGTELVRSSSGHEITLDTSIAFRTNEAPFPTMPHHVHVFCTHTSQKKIASKRGTKQKSNFCFFSHYLCRLATSFLPSREEPFLISHCHTRVAPYTLLHGDIMSIDKAQFRSRLAELKLVRTVFSSCFVFLSSLYIARPLSEHRLHCDAMS